MAIYPRDRVSSAGRVDHDPFTVFRRAFAANQTGSSMAFSAPTATIPTTATAGVHELEHGKKVIVMPYGANSAKEFRLGIQLWFPVYDKLSTVKTTETIAWIPMTAAIIDCTTVASTAANAGPLTTSDFFCTLALAANTTQPLVSTIADMVTDAGDVPTITASGSVNLETIGAKYIQFFVDIDGGAGTAANNGNALFAVI